MVMFNLMTKKKVIMSNHLHHLNKSLDIYLKSYDNILIMGDLNSEVSENCLNGFCHVNPLMHNVPKWSSICCKMFEVCLTILGHYALKG